MKSEALLDSVTAVSGAGPAYYFLMIEEMIKAGDEGRIRLRLETSGKVQRHVSAAAHVDQIPKQQAVWQDQKIWSG